MYQLHLNYKDLIGNETRLLSTDINVSDDKSFSFNEKDIYELIDLLEDTINQYRVNKKFAKSKETPI
jgi:myosin-crossreactive antigen